MAKRTVMSTGEVDLYDDHGNYLRTVPTGLYVGKTPKGSVYDTGSFKDRGALIKDLLGRGKRR